MKIYKMLFNTVMAVVLSACALVVQAQQGQTVVVFGASGRIGGDIAAEALNRGYQVIGVSRSPDRLQFDHPGFTAAEGDVTDPASFRQLAQRADAIVISVQGNAEGNAPEDSTHAIAAKVAVEVLSDMDDAPYVLQIGGATTLHNSEQAMAENLPFETKPGEEMWGMFFGHWVALQAYRASDIDWTVLTPPFLIVNGMNGDNNRTGSYRTSTEGAVFNDEGNSTVSQADLAVAAVDEITKRQFVGRRFTVGY